MQILHLNLEKTWRGGERQTLLTLLGLRSAGHQPALLARTNSPLANAAKENGIQVYECNSTWAMAWRLLRIAKKFDVIHAQTAQAATVLALIKPAALTVFTRRTAFISENKHKQQKWKWSRIDLLVAISQAAAQAPKDLGLAVDIIPSAVQARTANPDTQQQLINKYNLSQRTVVVTTAALSPEKDPATLIRAIDALRQTFPDVICLHCGADAAAAAQARELVSQLGLQDHYLFLGFQENVADYLAIAKIYISSSKFEALGTSVLDACLAGLPVVATDAGGHKEILAPDYGLLTSTGDSDAIAKKTAWLLQHPEVAQEMARRAQEMVKEQFSVPAMVASYIRLYKANIR